MERKVYLTKLKPEHRQAYLNAHTQVPEQVLKAYAKAGMTHCSVWLLGDQLVLIVDAADHDALREAMANDPHDREWQAYVGPMKEEGDWEETAPIFMIDF